MKKTKNYIKKPLAIFFVSIGLLTFLLGKKLKNYADDPMGEKDCPPLSPDSINDDTETNNNLVSMPNDNLPWTQKGGFINDASCLNKTFVYGVVSVKNEDDIKNAISFARQEKIKISMAGVKHSMGGHAFYKNALVLDMLGFNKISLNEEQKTITVQSGATWHDIQNFIHPRYAVKSMQSTDIFTVGGSISVNAHGMDHHSGSVSNSIVSMRIMMPDGTIKNLSRTENQELFKLVIGGYGLFGVILDVDLEIVDNDIYQSERQIIGYEKFPGFFAEELMDENVGLFYGHLSTAKSNKSFLKEMIVYKYKKSELENPQVPPLEEVSNIKLRRMVFNLSKKGALPMSFKWFAEKHLEHLFENCTISRNQAMSEGEACFVSRNEPMHDSVQYLRNNLKNETDILQEYFIPRDQFVTFIDGMREVIEKHDANLLNASIRVSHKEDNFLSYSPEDTFAVVLYFNQKTDQVSNDKMKDLTRELIDLSLAHKGRFFLPYQLYYTNEQLEKSYPEFRNFMKKKKEYDPEGLLTSTFYEKYSNL